MKLQYIVMIFLSILASNIIIILLHELGHALAIIKFCKGTINVYLGSYGKKEGNVLLKTPKIHFHIKKNIFNWKGGICIPPKDIPRLTFRHEFIFLIAGPIVPVIFATLFFYISKYYTSENLVLFSRTLLLVSIFSMIYNLVPRKNKILLADGRYNSNDGRALIMLLKFKNCYHEVRAAGKLYKEKKFIEAGNIYSKIIEMGIKHRDIYNLAIICYSSDKNFHHKAYEFINLFLNKFKARPEDLINIGHYYSQTENHEKALSYYKKSFDKRVTWHACNNIGFSLNETDQFSEALKYLDKAIRINPKHAYGYNNRAYTKLKLGRTQDAMEDLKTSYVLNPGNPYYYRNMGIYCFDKEEFSDALILFEKAKEKDPDTHKIDYYINKCKSVS